MSSFSISASSQLGIQYSVLRLYSWPELSRVPPNLVLDAARVAALLAVRPTGAPLISRLLDIPRERVAHVVEMLHLHGHLDDTTEEVRRVESEDEGELELVDVPQDTAPAASSSLLGRLWKRLSNQKD